MQEKTSTEKKYSTTRLLVKEKPVPEKNPKDKFETILFLPKNEDRKGEGGLRTQGYFKKSYENKPLVSVITAVYNGEKFLEKTIQSVLDQTYENIEYIVIDGGSTDGTIDIIKKYEDRISYWVSEPDKGVYEAMNKGLKVTTGEYIAILNADDYYTPDAIALSIEKIIDAKSDYSIANVEYVNNKGVIKSIYPLKENHIYQEMPYPHVSAFISSETYKKVGLFDTSFKIAGDHDMAVRIHMQGYKVCYVDKSIAYLEEGGISSGIDSNRESRQVAIKNGKTMTVAWSTYILQLLKVNGIKILPASIVKQLQKYKGSRFQ